MRAILAARREALFWRRAVAQDTPQAYWTYLRRYPHGPHVADAGRRLAILAAAAQPPSDFAPEDYADLPPPPQEEYVYADQPVYVFDGPDYGPPPPPPPPDFYYAAEDDNWRDLPPPAPPIAVGVLPGLVVAIPLLIGARAYQDAGRHEGRAPETRRRRRRRRRKIAAAAAAAAGRRQAEAAAAVASGQAAPGGRQPRRRAGAAVNADADVRRDARPSHADRRAVADLDAVDGADVAGAGSDEANAGRDAVDADAVAGTEHAAAD